MLFYQYFKIPIEALALYKEGIKRQSMLLSVKTKVWLKYLKWTENVLGGSAFLKHNSLIPALVTQVELSKC